MLPKCAILPNGVVHMILGVPPAETLEYVGGVGVDTETGCVYAGAFGADSVTNYANGLMSNPFNGRVGVTTSLPSNPRYKMGFLFNLSGNLFINVDQVPNDATDTFVGGVRVAANGSVYTTSIATVADT